MATKKQKRQRALEKREQYLEELRRENEFVLQQVREQRLWEARKAWEKPHEKHYRFVDECLLCAVAKQALIAEEIPDNSSMEMECI
jgi:hypothetical protein